MAVNNENTEPILMGTSPVNKEIEVLMKKIMKRLENSNNFSESSTEDGSERSFA